MLSNKARYHCVTLNELKLNKIRNSVPQPCYSHFRYSVVIWDWCLLYWIAQIWNISIIIRSLDNKKEALAAKLLPSSGSRGQSSKGNMMTLQNISGKVEWKEVCWGKWGQYLGEVISTWSGMPTESRVPGLSSTFNSNLTSHERNTLGGRRQWLRYLHPWRSQGRVTLSSGLLDLTWLNLDYRSHRRSKPMNRRSLKASYTLLPLCICLSNK